MKDIQNENDSRGIAIDMVGITKLKLPLLIPTKKGGTQQVVASVNFFTDLPHNIKGTHMSRFVETISDNVNKPMSFQQLKLIAKKLKKRLNAMKVYLSINFQYFISKKSPVSKKSSYTGYECLLQTEVNCKGDNQILTIKVPVMLLCPCSKAISKYNAHNQRAMVTLTADFIKPIHIEELAELIEKEASCELYSLLKRPDEKYVTEKSYNNPKFVEDIVRDVAVKLKNNSSFNSATIECESNESIHNHNAYAKLSININNISINK